MKKQIFTPITALVCITAATAGTIRSHRGNPFQWNEHCMGSWEAVALATPGVGLIEMDVRLSSDGVPVVFHDSTLDAKTTGTGTVLSKTLTALQALTLDEFLTPTAQEIPTLEDGLNFWKPYRVKIMIEEKVAAASEIASIVAKTGFPQDRLIILLYESVSTPATYRATSLKHCQIWAVASGSPTIHGSTVLATARATGYDGISFENFSWTEGDVTLMRNAGLLIGSDERFAGSITQFRDRLNLGSDLLLTDDAQARVAALDDVWWAQYATAQGIGTSVSTMIEDADTDGYTNLEEMLFGTNPNADNVAPTPLGYTLRYSGTGTERRAIITARTAPQTWDFVWFRPEWSTDGVTWTAVDESDYEENNSAWPSDPAWKFEINLGGESAAQQVRLTPQLAPRP